MILRYLSAWLLSLCLGCQSGSFLLWNSSESQAKEDSSFQPERQPLHEARKEPVVASCQPTPAPSMMENHLSLAAASLEREDISGAVSHLAKYAASHPTNLVVRGQYAELLLQLHRNADARIEFEELIVQGQDQPDWAAKHLVHCHRRLMEIAEEQENVYEEHLHRGIGLYLLADQRADLPDPEGDLAAEALLCRAAAELKAARLCHRQEARPCWYLSQVWLRLDQQQPANRYLREANSLAPFSSLTPAEKRELQLAYEGRTALATAAK